MPELHQQRVLELARRNAQRYTFRYRSLLLHWFGRALRRPEPVELSPLPGVDSGQVAVTWGGHSTALVRYHQLSVLCDPVLSRSVGGVPRERAPGLAAEWLSGVDLVLLSHSASDHLDLRTLSMLSRAATVVVPPLAGAQVSPLGFARLVELAPGSSLEHRGLEITAEAVRHGDRRSPAQSYVLRGDGPTVYYCAASGYFGGFAEIGRRHWPDVALLPIGGYWPPSFRKRHMSPLDALYAFEDLRARVMVPIGYGTFALSYEQLGDPDRWLAELVSERQLERFVVPLSTGETRVFVPPAVSAYDGLRLDSGLETGMATSPAVVARPRASDRPLPLRGPALSAPASPTATPSRGTVLPTPASAAATPVPAAAPRADAGAFTPAAGPEVVSPVKPAKSPHRPAALIVDHEDQEGETGVFAQPSALRNHGNMADLVPKLEEEDDEGSTHALTVETPKPDSEAGPVLVPVQADRS